MKFAVIQTGGKQYKVKEGDSLKIEKLLHEGENLSFDKVLLVADGKEIQVGLPFISGASVAAKVLEDARDKKKIVFRYHSKTRYRKKNTHRQPYTEVEITKI